MDDGVVAVYHGEFRQTGLHLSETSDVESFVL